MIGRRFGVKVVVVSFHLIVSACAGLSAEGAAHRVLSYESFYNWFYDDVALPNEVDFDARVTISSSGQMLIDARLENNELFPLCFMSHAFPRYLGFPTGLRIYTSDGSAFDPGFQDSIEYSVVADNSELIVMLRPGRVLGWSSSFVLEGEADGMTGAAQGTFEWRVIAFNCDELIHRNFGAIVWDGVAASSVVGYMSRGMVNYLDR